jgi:tRNA nucleotidyltransferase (CCA-adding enzyme)
VNQNLSEFLTKSLSPIQREIIRLASDEASPLGFPLYLVGGFVRDLLLGLNNLDIDLVVEGEAPELAHILVGKYDGKVTIHPRFRTAKWDIRDSRILKKKFDSKSDDLSAIPNFIDLVSARSETYKHPAALPTVKMGKIEDDLRRRDFSINTLALRLDNPYFGDLRDDYGGVEDLHRGLIRVLHKHSFIDDPTRMYRAVRYEQRFGFKIIEETLDLIPEALKLVKQLSSQRMRHELDLILEEPKRAFILVRLAQLDLIKPIHTALPWDETIQERIQVKRYPELLNRRDDDRLTAWLLWLMGLSNEQIVSLNKRLHFTASLLKALLASSKLFNDLPLLENRRPSEWVEYLDELPLLAVYSVYLGAQEGRSKLALGKYLREWRHVKPKTTGNDLKSLGLPPGPKYQKILRELRNAWLDEEVKELDGEKRLLEAVLRRS